MSTEKVNSCLKRKKIEDNHGNYIKFIVFIIKTQNKILILNFLVLHNFALVKWDKKELYNVVHMNTVEFQAGYDFGKTLYYVKFDQVKSKAILICIDTEEICNERLDAILSYRPNPLLQTKINKKPSGKVAEAIIDKNRDECKIQLLESQILSMQGENKSARNQSDKRCVSNRNFVKKK